jgi:phenylacetate-CoA ligase
MTVLRELRASERTPLDELHRRQDARLRRLVRWAYETVPAYRARFDDAGIRPESIRSAADLARLSVLTKRDLQAGGSAFWSNRIGHDRHWVHLTSGSTGEPLRAVRDVRLRSVGQGTWWHALEGCGVHPADVIVDIASHDRPWKSALRTRIAEAAGSRPITTEALFRRDAATINATLRGWRPRLISGQPQRIAQFARMVLEGDVRLPAPPAAVSYFGSVLTEEVRALIVRAFGAPIHSRYGAIEFVPMIATTCELGWFHVNPHHFIVEIASGDRGKPAATTTREGRVLVTDLTNFVAPYLRYEVGDVARWASDEPCQCGRTWPRFSSIDGRHAEVAVTASGREIAQSGLSREMFKAVHDLPDVVWEYQFRQHSLDDVELCIVPRPTFVASHADRIVAALNAFVRGEVQFRVTVVDAIPAAPSGKRPLLVNLMDARGRAGAP